MQPGLSGMQVKGNGNSFVKAILPRVLKALKRNVKVNTSLCKEPGVKTWRLEFGVWLSLMALPAGEVKPSCGDWSAAKVTWWTCELHHVPSAFLPFSLYGRNTESTKQQQPPSFLSHLFPSKFLFPSSFFHFQAALYWSISVYEGLTE